MWQLSQVVERLRNSGYIVSAADVSTLLGITVADATPGTTASITLEQAALAIAKLKQAGYILSATEVSTLLGLTVTDATTPKAPPELKALSRDPVEFKEDRRGGLGKRY